MIKIDIGTKVECIDDYFVDLDTNRFTKDEISLPEKGRTYTVREIYTNDSGTAVRLNEIINPSHYYEIPKKGFYEPVFSVHRFVPVKKD